jgi:hypothetical protein
LACGERLLELSQLLHRQRGCGREQQHTVAQPQQPSASLRRGQLVVGGQRAVDQTLGSEQPTLLISLSDAPAAALIDAVQREISDSGGPAPRG